jgi:predicted ester cyclase
MSLEENKALVRRVTEEVFNKRNVAALDEFFAPNLVPNNPLPPGMSRDREGYRQLTAAILTAFPDFRLTIEDMVAEGDKVVVLATLGN